MDSLGLCDSGRRVRKLSAHGQPIVFRVRVSPLWTKDVNLARSNWRNLTASVRASTLRPGASKARQCTSALHGSPDSLRRTLGQLPIATSSPRPCCRDSVNRAASPGFRGGYTTSSGLCGSEASQIRNFFTPYSWAAAQSLCREGSTLSATYQEEFKSAGYTCPGVYARGSAGNDLHLPRFAPRSG
jgi:hypothetical protein